MSIKKVEKFFELEKSDKNLVQKMKSISDEIQSKSETVDYEDVIKTKIIPIAKEYGFDFTLEDFLKYTSSIAQKGELSEADLLDVSGGLSAKQGLAMLGIVMTLTPLTSGFMMGNVPAGSGQQRSTTGQTSSYSVDVDDSASNNDEQNAEFEEPNEETSDFKMYRGIVSTVNNENNDSTTEADVKKAENQDTNENNTEENKEIGTAKENRNDVTAAGTGHTALNSVKDMMGARGSNNQKNKAGETANNHAGTKIKKGNNTDNADESVNSNEGSNGSEGTTNGEGNNNNDNNTTTEAINNNGNFGKEVTKNNNADESVNSNEGYNGSKDTTNGEGNNNAAESVNNENNNIPGRLGEATNSPSERGVLDNLMNALKDGNLINQAPLNQQVNGSTDNMINSNEGYNGSTDTTNGEENSAVKKDSKTALNQPVNGSTDKPINKLTINALKKAVELVFGNQIDESKGTFVNGAEVIYGYDEHEKPFALNSSGYVYSYENGTSNQTLQQSLTLENISEVNKAELAAEEAARVKAEAESNKNKTAADSSANSITEANNAAKKDFWSQNGFSNWSENGDGTLTAQDSDGVSYTFIKYDESEYKDKPQDQQLDYLLNIIDKTGNDSSKMLGEDRSNFLSDLGNFVGLAWNAKNSCLEVSGISKEDSRLGRILDAYRNLGGNCWVNCDIADNLTLSEKLKALVKIVNRINSLEDVGYKSYAFISVLQETLNSKAYNTTDGTINGLIADGSEDEKNYKTLVDFLKANNSNYPVEYHKQGALINNNKPSKDAGKLIYNWIETGNKIQNFKELKNSADFKNDAKEIVKLIQYRYQDKEMVFEIPGVVEPETVNTFLNIWYGVGLSKNVSYTSVASDNTAEFLNNLQYAVTQNDSNVFNIARADLVNYIKDCEKAKELSSQDGAKKEGQQGNTNSTSRRSKINQVLNGKSIKELDEEIGHLTKKMDRVTDEAEKSDALVAIIKLNRIKANQEKNNAKNTATEETLISANDGGTTEQEETQANKNKNVKYTPFKSNMSVAFKGFFPSLWGGKSLIEQKKDHLANFIKDEGITTSNDISADSTKDFYADIMEVGSKLTYNTINNSWYLDGSTPEPSQNQALDLVHRIYARLLNSARG